MAVKRDSRNNSNPQHRGNPSDTGKNKASIKPSPDQDELEKQEEIKDEYGNELEGIDPDTRIGSHPNRNTNKPDIDKPAYS